MKEVEANNNIFEQYDNHIILRRWFATWLDFIALAIILLAFIYVLPDLDDTAIPLIALTIVLAYYILLEGFLGATLGKFIAGIRVVDLNAQPPGIIKAIIRTSTRIIEVNPFLMGGLPAGIIVLSTIKRQRLGDIFANTYVFRNEDVQKMRVLISKLQNSEISIDETEEEKN